MNSNYFREREYKSGWKCEQCFTLMEDCGVVIESCYNCLEPRRIDENCPNGCGKIRCKENSCVKCGYEFYWTCIYCSSRTKHIDKKCRTCLKYKVEEKKCRLVCEKCLNFTEHCKCDLKQVDEVKSIVKTKKVKVEKTKIKVDIKTNDFDLTLKHFEILRDLDLNKEINIHNWEMKYKVLIIYIHTFFRNKNELNDLYNKVLNNIEIDIYDCINLRKQLINFWLSEINKEYQDRINNILKQLLY